MLLCVKVFYNQMFKFKFRITDKIFLFYKKNQKKTSEYSQVVVKWGIWVYTLANKGIFGWH